MHWVRGRGTEGATCEDRCLIAFEFNGSGFFSIFLLVNPSTKLFPSQNQLFTFVMEDI